MKYVPVHPKRGPLVKTLRADSGVEKTIDHISMNRRVPVETLWDLLTQSTVNFILSAYFKNNKWFKSKNQHVFHGLHFETPGERDQFQDFVIDLEQMLITTELDTDFCIVNDEYASRRVIEETRVEAGLVDT